MHIEVSNRICVDRTSLDAIDIANSGLMNREASINANKACRRCRPVQDTTPVSNDLTTNKILYSL
jgi:hypothetical protein